MLSIKKEANNFLQLETEETSCKVLCPYNDFSTNFAMEVIFSMCYVGTKVTAPIVQWE